MFTTSNKLISKLILSQKYSHGFRATCILNKAILRKLLLPRPITYLMEYAFTFTFASWEFPPISVSCIVYDNINRPGNLGL